MKCASCHLFFTEFSVKQFVDHVDEHNKGFFCALCANFFSNKKEFSKHLKRMHSMNFKSNELPQCSNQMQLDLSEENQNYQELSVCTTLKSISFSVFNSCKYSRSLCKNKSIEKSLVRINLISRMENLILFELIVFELSLKF